MASPWWMDHVLRLVIACALAVSLVATPSAASAAAVIHRSAYAKHEFWRMTGHPNGWRGHVVDHVIPLACGGQDKPTNMQWQTIAEGRAKDRWERRKCQTIHTIGQGNGES